MYTNTYPQTYHPGGTGSCKRHLGDAHGISKCKVYVYYSPKNCPLVLLLYKFIKHQKCRRRVILGYFGDPDYNSESLLVKDVAIIVITR